MKFVSLYRYIFYIHYISIYHNPYWMRCVLSVSAICRMCIGKHRGKLNGKSLIIFIKVSLCVYVLPCIGYISACILLSNYRIKIICLNSHQDVFFQNFKVSWFDSFPFKLPRCIPIHIRHIADTLRTHLIQYGLWYIEV